jgi:hypothetical protein
MSKKKQTKKKQAEQEVLADQVEKTVEIELETQQDETTFTFTEEISIPSYTGLSSRGVYEESCLDKLLFRRRIKNKVSRIVIDRSLVRNASGRFITKFTITSQK